MQTLFWEFQDNNTDMTAINKICKIYDPAPTMVPGFLVPGTAASEFNKDQDSLKSLKRGYMHWRAKAYFFVRILSPTFQHYTPCETLNLIGKLTLHILLILSPSGYQTF